MDTNTVKIEASQFSDFAKDNQDNLEMVVGCIVIHSVYGQGTITNIKPRPDRESLPVRPSFEQQFLKTEPQKNKLTPRTPRIDILFETGDTLPFESDGFKSGNFGSMTVPKQFYDLALQRKKEQEIKNECLATVREIEIIGIFSKYGILCLWHMTHKDNIFSILEYGIVNHYCACKINASRVDISDPDVQRWRENIEPHYHRRIHNYVPLYINPLNPMLYVRKNIQADLCLMEISLSVLSKNQYLITDGNAASHDTKFYNSVNNLELLPWDVLHADYWNDFPDGKRKRCAEVLVYPAISPKFVIGIHCCSNKTLNFLSNSNSNVSITKKLFF